MPAIADIMADAVENSWVEIASQLAGAATATHAAAGSATGVSRRCHYLLKCDASYSSSTQSGLLEIKFGTATIAHKVIHGAGALDFGIFGFKNPDSNEAVSAVLAAGAGGITGYVSLTGFSSIG